MEFDFKKKLIRGLILTFSLFVIIYAFFKAEDLIFGVSIENVNIENQTAFDKSKIEISGNARHATALVLNGREISIDKEGNFKEDIGLSIGYNIINIKAKDKFGHEDEKNYKLTFIPSPASDRINKNI